MYVIHDSKYGATLALFAKYIHGKTDANHVLFSKRVSAPCEARWRRIGNTLFSARRTFDHTAYFAKRGNMHYPSIVS